MSENLSIDTHAGENPELPAVLKVSTFAAARGKEIDVMKKALSSASGTKLAFQKLPRHMRRRTMSHNVKRLPRRLREIHLNQMMKSGLPPKQKRPSRKYRRRPYNLTSEYMRRQRRCKWLDTHIWHAKRFHMIEKWGYKLPYRPCDKAFRACYRATVNHCLLQDISYYSCIEISGEGNTIIDHFKAITDSSTGLTIAAKSYTKGYREGNVTLFKCDKSRKAIGNIYFHWKPIQDKNKHVLWLWIHAAYYDETLDTLIDCFKFNLISMDQENSDNLKSYSNNNNIELKELKLELSRFRLTGPLSNAVLHNAFLLAESSTGWMEKDKNCTDSQMSTNEYWKSLKCISSASELSPHIILPLTILDPRFNLPKKRTKSIPNTVSLSVISSMPKNCDSPLWDSDIRKAVKDGKIPNAALAELRSNLLVPGSDLEEKGVPIPIILIQRPGKQSQGYIGYSSGWDLILPAVWAQPIWLSLIMWGARAGGLREANSINFELGEENILYPDTVAGAEEENSKSNKYKETFFKLPPNKRTNYAKFNIASPFNWNWKLLLSDWSENKSPVTDFFIMRNKVVLLNIQEILTSRSKKYQLPDCRQNCLIPVRITLLHKGLCKNFAIICLPKEGDVQKAPVEAHHSDPNEKKRKRLRKEHKTLLKRLRQRRKRARRKGKTIPIDMDILKNYTSTMRKLWLPDATTIRHSCSREVLGFIKEGGFSFLLGKSKAIGYIAMGALPIFLSSKFKDKILIRNTNSKQYTLGTLEIICK